MKGDRSPFPLCEHLDVCPRLLSHEILTPSKWNDASAWMRLRDGGSKRQLVFALKATKAFLLGTLNSPLSPKQQRNVQQACARARVGKLVSVGAHAWMCVCVRACVCVGVCVCGVGGCIYKSKHQFNFLNIRPTLWEFPFLSLSTSPPPLCRRFDMLNLLILFFFLLWWGSVLFKVLGFPPPHPPPPDCLNPTSVWFVFFLFQTKDRGRITIPLPFTLGLSSGRGLGIFHLVFFKKKTTVRLLFTFYYFSCIEKVDDAKITVVEFRAPHQQYARPFFSPRRSSGPVW